MTLKVVSSLLCFIQITYIKLIIVYNITIANINNRKMSTKNLFKINLIYKKINLKP